MCAARVVSFQRINEAADESNEEQFRPGACNRRCHPLLCIAVVVALVLVIALVTAIAVGVTVGASSSSAGVGDPWLNVSLPPNIQPQTYELSLSVDLTKFTVQGVVTISAAVQAATPYILVHALDMDISSTSVSTGTISDQFFYTKNEFYVIVMNEDLPAGQSIVITLNFNYNITDGLSGFYRSSYTTNGTTAYLANTQFEPTDARRAFPCFDEPAFKANFTIHITHDCHYTAVSNMPISSMSGDCTSVGSSVTTSFQTSVRMSTYLVAFIVSQFSYVNGTTGGSNPVEVIVLAAAQV